MVNIETREYIRYYFPSWYENKWEDVDIGDWKEARKKINIPEGCVGYRQFIRKQCAADDGEILRGEPQYVSTTHFIGGNGVKIIDNLEDMRENMFELQSFARHIMKESLCRKVI